MTNAEKDAIVKLIEEYVEKDSTCTLSWAFHQITNLSSESQPHSDIDRVVARLVEGNKYRAERRGYEYGHDFTIAKNPAYKPQPYNERHPYLHALWIALIAAVISQGISYIINIPKKIEQKEIDNRQDTAILKFGLKLDSIKFRK